MKKKAPVASGIGMLRLSFALRPMKEAVVASTTGKLASASYGFDRG